MVCLHSFWTKFIVLTNNKNNNIIAPKQSKTLYLKIWNVYGSTFLKRAKSFA